MILVLEMRLGWSTRGFVGTLGSFTSRRTTRKAVATERRPDNLACFDIVEILWAHGTDMTRFPAMVALGCFHPFKKGKGGFAGIDNIGAIFVAGEGVVCGDFMLDVDPDSFSFLCT